VPSPNDDFPFGREISYQHCHPAQVTANDSIDYVEWVTKRTGAVGYRFDDTKGTYAPAVRQIMDALPETPFYSEYFDGNPATLNWWATSSPMEGRSAVEDFTLHWRLQAACDSFDATQLTNGDAGYWQWNSNLAVGFVDNPDTDTSFGEQVIENKGLAYAYMLTLPLRAALVYGKDYYPSSVWPGAYGLKPLIDNLCWINRTFAFGGYQVRWVDKDVHVASRDGNGGGVGWSGGLLTALNFNTFSARSITCATPFGPNRHLHDYTGRHDDIFTDGNGNASFTIPANSFARGQSYLCFAPAGVDHPVASTSRTTMQVYEAAPDLDIMPAGNAVQKLPQRICCARGSEIRLSVTGALPAGASLTATVKSPSGTIVAQERIGAGALSQPGKASAEGWHEVFVEGSRVPAAGVNFKLAVSYLGGQA
jgi:alpha-amylase